MKRRVGEILHDEVDGELNLISPTVRNDVKDVLAVLEISIQSPTESESAEGASLACALTRDLPDRTPQEQKDHCPDHRHQKPGRVKLRTLSRL
jgi:hypothetical protein